MDIKNKISFVISTLVSILPFWTLNVRVYDLIVFHIFQICKKKKKNTFFKTICVLWNIFPVFPSLETVHMEWIVDISNHSMNPNQLKLWSMLLSNSPKFPNYASLYMSMTPNLKIPKRSILKGSNQPLPSLFSSP